MADEVASDTELRFRVVVDGEVRLEQRLDARTDDPVDPASDAAQLVNDLSEKGGFQRIELQVMDPCGDISPAGEWVTQFWRVSKA